jgi:hypothetical protein
MESDGDDDDDEEDLNVNGTRGKERVVDRLRPAATGMAANPCAFVKQTPNSSASRMVKYLDVMLLV